MRKFRLFLTELSAHHTIVSGVVLSFHAFISVINICVLAQIHRMNMMFKTNSLS